MIRYSANIFEPESGTNVYAEVCEKMKISKDTLEKTIKHKAKKFEDHLRKIGIDEVKFNYTIMENIPRSILINNASDKAFVKQNLPKYGNLLYNEFYDNTKFASNPDLILKNFDAFLDVMSKIKSGYFDKLYNKVKPLSPEYDKLIKRLKDYEEDLLK